MNFASELYSRLEDLNLWEKTIVVERNGYLTAYGSVERSLYYVVSGSLKVCMQDTLEEHIVRFGYTGDFVTSLDSFISGRPSVFLIQAIKKTKVKQISRSACLSFIKQDPANGQLWQDMLEQLVLQQLEREMDLLTSSPKDRYQRVLQRSPELFHRIPHKHIASYLKMAPETLSRLKKS
ncbi:CRP-like cAMP-binding protein [Sphingobacterium allocomposti]|jgi:CRP-like cAMP-binding protein|uniref:CRP-like cAMP-binding protein n=1 Tax=Sphingobacterium allocomposti TaxID=415956 RepID=A0A5S5DLJ0_9SPHI|nr:Crp/Fnr family transcriptional regulator [Sphingobacterium composti Yoo et al. 2007 non Ten et al. 2007]TYP96238.1 CRP-like cAMP-binding protein [Sphingobacterium composti Yoo et al. 2007 non Ten et al. 2007]